MSKKLKEKKLKKKLDGKKLKKQQNRLSVFSNMLHVSLQYLKQLEENTPEEKKYYEKISEELIQLFHLYRKRVLKKYYDIYGGPTPFDEKIDDIKLEPTTYEECILEYNALVNMFRCAHRYWCTQNFTTLEEEKTYFEIIEEYRKVYHFYEKELFSKMEKFYKRLNYS